MYTYIHPYIPTYLLHTYVDTYIHTYLPTYLHTYIPTYLHTYIPTYLPMYVRTYLHTYIPTYLPTYLVRTYLHTDLQYLYTLYLYMHYIYPPQNRAWHTTLHDGIKPWDPKVGGPQGSGNGTCVKMVRFYRKHDEKPIKINEKPMINP